MTVFRLAFQSQCDATKKVHNCSKVSQEKINFLIFKKSGSLVAVLHASIGALLFLQGLVRPPTAPAHLRGWGGLTTTTCKTARLTQSGRSHLAHIPPTGSRPTLPILSQPLWILWYNDQKRPLDAKTFIKNFATEVPSTSTKYEGIFCND